MSTVNPFIYYPNPTNDLYVTWHPINKTVQLSGSGRGIYSQEVIGEYQVVITYQGKVQIGERTVHSEAVPNYARQNYVIRQAQANTGIIGNGDVDCVDQTICICCACTIVCAYCGWLYTYNQGNKRKEKLNAEIDRIALDEFLKKVGTLLQAADTRVTTLVQTVRAKEKQEAERIAALQRATEATQALTVAVQQRSGVQQEGGIVVSQAQYEQFKQFQAMLQMAQQTPVPQLPGNSGPLLTMQYQLQQQQVQPTQSLQTPTAPSQQLGMQTMSNLAPSSTMTGGLGVPSGSGGSALAQRATLEIAPPDTSHNGSKARI